MEKYRLGFPAKGKFPAFYTDFVMLASQQKEDGSYRFLLDVIMPSEPQGPAFQTRQHHFCYAKPVDPSQSVLAMVHFSAERIDEHRIINLDSGKVYHFNVHRTKEMNNDLWFVGSMDSVLYQGLLVRLPKPVENGAYQQFLNTYEHPFFKVKIRASRGPVKTLYDSVPEQYRSAIEVAVAILKKEGAREVYLFGEKASAQAKEKTTGFELAVSGLPNEIIIRVQEEIQKALRSTVTLFNLETNRQFFSLLKPTGHMIKLL